MAFITKWAQTFILLPTGGSQFPAYIQWWRFTGVFTPDPFNWTIGANKFRDWWMAGLGQLVNSTGLDVPAVHLYIHDATGDYKYTSSFSGGFYPTGDCLPNTHGVIIRRFGGILRSQFGHFNCPGVNPIYVTNGALNDAGMTVYQSIADITPLVVTHSSCIFRPITASYKNVTATNVTKLLVRPRLGVLHRRAHLHPGFTWQYTPKAPPV
jgi:hypothetical protein